MKNLNNIKEIFLVFLKKNFFIDLSYKTQFIGSYLSIFITVFIFYFLSNYINLQTSNSNLDYFAFSIIGIAAADFILITSSHSSNLIREYQLNGILDEILKSQFSLAKVLLYENGYVFIKSVLRFLFYILCAYFVFSLDSFTFFILIQTFLIICLSFMGSFGIALIGAACIIYFKKGNPVILVHTALCGMIAGVLYPVNSLPGILQFISNFLPLKHTIEIIRDLTFNNTDSIFVNVSFILLLGILYIIIGIICLKYSLNFCKKNNSLTTY